MADCKACHEKRREFEPVPYMAHEKAEARHERIVNRIITALVVVTLLWFGTVGVFVWYLNQYDVIESSSTVTVDAKDGVANYIGNDGDIVNGENYCHDKNPRP